MRGACSIALVCLVAAGNACAQPDTETPVPKSSEQQSDELRVMEEQRAALLEELQKLREDLAASEARMAESRERIRQLRSQQTPPAKGEP